MGLVRAADRRAALLMAGTALILLSGCGRVGGEAFQPTHTATLPLGRSAGGAETLGQSFAPAGERLSEIDFLTATYGRTPDGRLRVRLLGPDRAVLGAAVLDGEAIQENAWTSVRFEPPPRVPSMVLVELEWDGDDPVGLRSNIPAEEAATAGTEGAEPLQNDPYAGGQLHRNGQPVPGDLAFRVVGADGVAAAPGALTGVLDQAATTLRQTPRFTAAWVVLVLVAVGLAALGLGTRQRVGARADKLDEGGPHEQRREGHEGRP